MNELVLKDIAGELTYEVVKEAVLNWHRERRRLRVKPSLERIVVTHEQETELMKMRHTRYNLHTKCDEPGEYVIGMDGTFEGIRVVAE